MTRHNMAALEEFSDAKDHLNVFKRAAHKLVKRYTALRARYTFLAHDESKHLLDTLTRAHLLLQIETLVAECAIVRVLNEPHEPLHLRCLAQAAFFWRRTMRQNLEPYRGKRITLTGVFDKYGCRTDKTGTKINTALFQALQFDGRDLCTHCHVQFADTLIAYGLRHGEHVSFDALVMQYKRRLPITNADGVMVETDYGLYHPTNVKLLDRETPDLPSLIRDEPLTDAPEATGTNGHMALGTKTALARSIKVEHPEWTIKQILAHAKEAHGVELSYPLVYGIVKRRQRDQTSPARAQPRPRPAVADPITLIAKAKDLAEAAGGWDEGIRLMQTCKSL